MTAPQSHEEPFLNEEPSQRIPQIVLIVVSVATDTAWLVLQVHTARVESTPDQ